MTHAVMFLDAGPLTINGTFIVEIIGFLLMLLFLSKVPLPFLGIPKPVFPWIISVAEARQRLITEQLDAATSEQLKQELKQRAEEEAQRVTAAARKEIEVERERAIQSARAEVADLVVSATEKVLGETLDGPKHQQLIERAIAEVASGDSRG
jgi:F0F1-type ATP synthase membrane subunit b/b'